MHEGTTENRLAPSINIIIIIIIISELRLQKMQNSLTDV